MKKIALLLFISIILFSFQFNWNITTTIEPYHGLKNLRTSGTITSQTGAPGEQDCTSCHNDGTVQDGNEKNNLTFLDGSTEYTPGEMVSVKLELDEATTKNGFQLVVLDDDNEMAGNFAITDDTGTQLRTSDGLNRSYVTHTSAGTSENTWEFDWETPTEGGDVTFYVAVNRSDDDGSNNGDLIYLSQHNFSADDEGTTSLAQRDLAKNDFTLFFDEASARLKFNFNIIADVNVFFNLVDMNGRSVYSTSLGKFYPGEHKEVVQIPKNLKTGVYITTLFFDNRPVSKKIMVR